MLHITHTLCRTHIGKLFSSSEGSRTFCGKVGEPVSPQHCRCCLLDSRFYIFFSEVGAQLSRFWSLNEPPTDMQLTRTRLHFKELPSPHHKQHLVSDADGSFRMSLRVTFKP